MTWLLLIVGLALAILGSAGAAALVTSARSALPDAISRRLRGGQESFDWLAESERLVVGAMAVSSLGVVIMGVAIPGIFDRITLPQLVLLLLFLVVPATLFGGHILPRWLTVPRAGLVVQALRRPLSMSRSMLSVVLPGGAHETSEDLQALAREGNASGLVAGDELMMVGGVMTFAERPVHEVMTPRTDVVAISSEDGYEAVLATFVESGYTRLPVYRETLDDIIGMVHAFDLFKLDRGNPLPLRPVAHAPESRAAADLLVDMQRERRHFAVVLDEFGGTAGIVTLEDLLEALVGEISDEDEAEAEVINPTTPVTVLFADGSFSIDDVAEHFGVSLPESDAVTFTGLLQEMAGRIPAAGERFLVGALEVDVVEASPARIERVMIRRAGVPTWTLRGPA